MRPKSKLMADKNNEINILDVLYTLVREKWTIIKIVGSITLIALVVSLVWPVTYKSSAMILPPKSGSILPGGLGGLLSGNLGQMGMGTATVNSEAALSILKSRSLQEEIIERFNYREVYGTDIKEVLVRQIDQNTSVDEQREGGFGFSPLITVSISFKDRDAERAQQVVDFYITRLKEIIRDINKTYAESSYRMVERRYQQNLVDIEAAELALKEFQEKYGIFEVEEQGRILVDNIAQLKAKSTELDIQIAVLRESYSENQAQLQNLIRTRQEVERTINELLRQSDTSDAAEEFVFFPLDRMPELALEYFRLYREVMIQNKVLEAIYPQVQYQEMMITGEGATIQIIDPPNFPTYKDSPKRALIVLAGMLFSIFLALIVVFYREIMRRGEEDDSGNYHKLRQILEELKFRKKPAETQS